MGQLSTSSTYVFDFGAEMYVWHGKEVSMVLYHVNILFILFVWKSVTTFFAKNLENCKFIFENNSKNARVGMSK